MGAPKRSKVKLTRKARAIDSSIDELMDTNSYQAQSDKVKIKQWTFIRKPTV